MNTFKKLFTVAVLTLGLALPAQAQFGSPLGDRGPTNSNFGGNYKDPQQRAADHLAKGLRYKEKAAKETDAKKKAKLLGQGPGRIQELQRAAPEPRRPAGHRPDRDREDGPQVRDGRLLAGPGPQEGQPGRLGLL